MGLVYTREQSLKEDKFIIEDVKPLKETGWMSKVSMSMASFKGALKDLKYLVWEPVLGTFPLK